MTTSKLSNTAEKGGGKHKLVKEEVDEVGRGEEEKKKGVRIEN